MHGYDTYDFDHRGFYPAASIFTTIDRKAEETPDVSPYSYACNNPVRYRDENGDGAGDIISGIANAFVDDANPLSNLSATASRGNEKHYQIGQAVGHFVAALVGTTEMIEGGGTAAGGAVVAVTTSGTVVGAAAGAAVATGGAVVATHGAMMLAAAGTKLAGQKQKIDNASDATKNRVKLRTGTKETIREAAPKTKDGRYIDPNTGKPIEKGQEAFGHKTGQEWKKYKNDPANKGKSRKEVIKDQNDPNKYQIEDRKSNSSHKYEAK